MLCEGEVTEPKYLNAFKHEHRSQLVEVEVIGEGVDPKSIVEHAIKRKKGAEKEAKRRHDPYLKFDEIWCVFDVDDHPTLLQAKQQARDNGLNLAISSPCFELWILLHFRDHRTEQERGVIQALVREHLHDFDKEVPYDEVQPHYGEAVRRATDLMVWQVQQGRPDGNPSTAVHKLTERIAELGKDRFLRQHT